MSILVDSVELCAEANILSDLLLETADDADEKYPQAAFSQHDKRNRVHRYTADWSDTIDISRGKRKIKPTDMIALAT